MPLTDDERAALERLHRSNGRPDDVAVAVTIALREHPADEGHGLDETWISSVIPRLRPGYGYILNSRLCVMNSRDGWGLYAYACETLASDFELEPIRVANLATRGDVYRLLGALRIGGKHTESVK